MNGLSNMVPIAHTFGRLGNQMFQYAYLYSQFLDGVIPDIYLQSERYFGLHKEEIKALFGTGIGSIDKVSIHVRRGDYINNPFYVDLTATDYYQRAMSLFPGESFFVFSDDIPWCKSQEIFKECAFSEETDEVKDLNLMASCKAHIIANSSFSWWAAYLGGGRTIAPKAWHADGFSRTELPDNWEII